MAQAVSHWPLTMETRVYARVSIMDAPLEVARSGWVGLESDNAHAYHATAKTLLFHIHRPTSSHSRVVCLCV
jgi:hypothetical protein